MKKYRIVKYEKTEVSQQNHIYIVEQRFLLFFWRKVYDPVFPYVPKSFMTLYAAEYFIGGLKQLDRFKKNKIEKYI